MTNQDENLIVPPHNLDAERVVLGCCLLEKISCLTALSILSESDFFHPPHRYIWRAFRHLVDSDKSVDQVTLVDILLNKNHLQDAGGADYIIGLTNTVPSVAATEHYADIVLEKSRLRQIHYLANRLSAECIDKKTDSKKVLDMAMSELIEISKSKSDGSDPVDIETAILEIDKHIKKVREGEIERPIKLGFPTLDSMLILLPGNVFVVSGHTNHGKSTFCVAAAMNVIAQGKKALFISTEMEQDEMTHRFIAYACDIPIGLLRSSNIENLEVHPEVRILMEYRGKLKLACPTSCSELDISRIVKQETLLYGKPDLLVIDHLHDMEHSNKRIDYRLQIGGNIKAIKTICKELNIPCVLAAHLRKLKDGYKDQEKRPTMHDIAESSIVMQTAAAIGLIHRIEEDRSREHWEMGFYLDKNRNGPTGDMRFMLHRPRARLFEHNQYGPRDYDLFN